MLASTLSKTMTLPCDVWVVAALRWSWWPARSISSPCSPFERVLVHRSSAGESPAAPPVSAPQCRPPFPAPHFSRTLSDHVAHQLSTSLRPCRLMPARMAPSAGGLEHPLQLPQARIGTRRHHRYRERHSGRGWHGGCRPAHRIADAIVGRASSVACARKTLYPAPWQSRAGCAVCMHQVSAATAAAAATLSMAVVAAGSGTGAELPARERAGIAPGARRRGAAGVVSGQGSRQ